jgi:thiamine pyrophosphate-dependent acetolactate synthase large subunit-like protein
MIGTKPVYHAITDCDLFLMLGADYPYSAFLRPKGAVVQVDERAQVLGRRAPTTLGTMGGAAPTTPDAPRAARTILRELLLPRLGEDERRKGVLSWRQDRRLTCGARRSFRGWPKLHVRDAKDPVRRQSAFTIGSGAAPLRLRRGLKPPFAEQRVG